MGETSFQPAEIIAALERHAVRYIVIGGLAATLHGSPVMTTDADICPAREGDNLERLARALVELRARIRTSGAPEGLAFACDARFLSRIEVALNLTTRFGDLDLSFVPSGTSGFEDLRQQAVTMSLMGRPVAVASLADIVAPRKLPTARRIKSRFRRFACCCNVRSRGAATGKTQRLAVVDLVALGMESVGMDRDLGGCRMKSW